MTIYTAITRTMEFDGVT